MITDPLHIAKALNNILLDLQEEGLIIPNKDGDLKLDRHFPFSASDIKGIHTHKIGIGDGVFFRLKDDRVFDKYGDEHEQDKSLYDTVPN